MRESLERSLDPRFTFVISLWIWRSRHKIAALFHPARSSQSFGIRRVVRMRCSLREHAAKSQVITGYLPAHCPADEAEAKEQPPHRPKPARHETRQQFMKQLTNDSNEEVMTVKPVALPIHNTALCEAPHKGQIVMIRCPVQKRLFRDSTIKAQNSKGHIQYEPPQPATREHP